MKLIRETTVSILIVLTAVAFILTMNRCAHADEWTSNEIIAEVAWETLHLIDWGQTRNISNRLDEGYYEKGVAKLFIGKHPDTYRVDMYMAASALLHPVITHYLPRRYTMFGYTFNPRAAWQLVSIGVSGGYVINNASIGLKVDF